MSFPETISTSWYLKLKWLCKPTVASAVRLDVLRQTMLVKKSDVELLGCRRYICDRSPSRMWCQILWKNQIGDDVKLSSSSGDDSCSPVALTSLKTSVVLLIKLNFFMIESVTLSLQFFLFMYVFFLFMYFVGWPIFCLRHPPERPSDAGRHPQAPERGEEDRCVGHAQTAVSTTCRLGVYVCVRVCACVFTRVIGSYYLNRLAELKTRLLFHSQRNWYDCLFWCCYIIHGANIVSSVQRV